MDEAEMHGELTELKHEVTALKEAFADLKTEVRVTKHDVANLAQLVSGFNGQLEKVGDRLSLKIETLAAAIAAVTVKTEKGAGFVAGVIAAATAAAGLLLFMARLLFGGTQ